MACESDSAQAAKQRMMQSDAVQLMWRQSVGTLFRRGQPTILAERVASSLPWLGSEISEAA
eukprot:777313-Prymnesium_polylepis.1